MHSPQMLTILGKVDRRLLKKLLRTPLKEKENSLWLFVDYAASETPIGSHFDVLLEGEEKSLVPEKTFIKLINILDQFGNSLECLPKGFQTLCELHFSPNIPKEIRNLPSLTDWDYNQDSISIANHQDIKLNYPNGLLKDMYKIVSEHFYAVFISFSNSDNSFSKKDFIETVVSKFHTNPLSAEKMLHDMMLLGHVKSSRNEKLELVSE